MFFVPAVLIGAFIVFCAGYVITTTVLTKIDKSKTGNPTYYRGTMVLVNRPNLLKEKRIETISIIGGVVTVGLLILSLVFLPRPVVTIIGIGLTVIGVITGILTFFIKW